MARDQEYRVDYFDRVSGNLQDLPDVVRTRPSTRTLTLPLVGATHTYICQTYRQAREGDTIFLQCISGGETVRLALPPQVADLIATQRESLTRQSRRKAGREKMKKRMDEGFVPFQKVAG